MVLTPSERLLDELNALPAGARLLAALVSPTPLPGVFLVGGAVRDLLLGLVPHELDLVVEGDPEAVAAALRERLGASGPSHERFRTAAIATADGMLVDVAGARTETYARPGALPDVAPGTVASDMARRDFTVNAIAVGLSGDRSGEVHAAPEAFSDLDARLLRVLHPRSFVDDPTRLLRLVRYAARLEGFSIEPETERLAREAFASGAPETAGLARMGNELMLLLAEPTAIDGLVLLASLGGAPDVDEALLRRAVALLPADGRPDLLLLAAGARLADRADLEARLTAMHLRAPDAQIVLDAAADPEALATSLALAERPSEIASIARRRSAEAVALAGALGAEENARRWLGDLRSIHTTITGSDLLAAGVPQGPEIGRRLDTALAAKLDGRAKTHEDELAAALEDPS